MQNVYSLTGAHSDGEVNWVWCIPGMSLPPSACMALMVMSTDGPRFVPTSIAAPMPLRSSTVEFTQVKPSAFDLELVDLVYKWFLTSRKHEPRFMEYLAAVQLGNNVATAARFLTAGHTEFRPAFRPVC